MITLREATDAMDIAAVQTLCWAYRDELMSLSDADAEITRTFYPEPKYRALMDGLAQAHARPRGIILLAERDGKAVGCGMTHALSRDTSEVKRVFVDPQARGAGVARKLMQALMAQARADGFTRLLLDTSVNLGPARALYAALGFRARGPYQDIPADVLPHLLFFETDL